MSKSIVKYQDYKSKLGLRFEDIVCNHISKMNIFKKIYREKDIIKNFNRNITAIDILCITNTDNYIAIQCKFTDNPVPNQSILKFISHCNNLEQILTSSTHINHKFTLHKTYLTYSDIKNKSKLEFNNLNLSNISGKYEVISCSTFAKTTKNSTNYLLYRKSMIDLISKLDKSLSHKFMDSNIIYL
jgi:predicted helicase